MIAAPRTPHDAVTRLQTRSGRGRRDPAWRQLATGPDHGSPSGARDGWRTTTPARSASRLRCTDSRGPLQRRQLDSGGSRIVPNHCARAATHARHRVPRDSRGRPSYGRHQVRRPIVRSPMCWADATASRCSRRATSAVGGGLVSARLVPHRRAKHSARYAGTAQSGPKPPTRTNVAGGRSDSAVSSGASSRCSSGVTMHCADPLTREHPPRRLITAAVTGQLDVAKAAA